MIEKKERMKQLERNAMTEFYEKHTFKPKSNGYRRKDDMEEDEDDS
jgi:hypothetical protein